MSRAHYSAEFKANAVRRLNTPGQEAQALAKEFGVHESLRHEGSGQSHSTLPVRLDDHRDRPGPGSFCGEPECVEPRIKHVGD